MPKTPSLSSRDIAKLLTEAGFVQTRQAGSHVHWIKGDRRVTVPAGRKDMKTGTLRSIFRQAGLPWPPA
jgi:predicted RNA binding protein YcfA (HicA-like mRNA interferase family)